MRAKIERRRQNLWLRGCIAESLEGRLLLSAGQVDKSFATNGSRVFDNQLGISLRDAAVDSSGRIVVLFADASTGVSAIARFLSNGSEDPSFGEISGSSLGLIDTLGAIAVQSDGKVLVAGSPQSGNFNGNFIVTRFGLTGAIDGTFGDGGSSRIDVGEGSFVSDMAVRGDDRIIVAGSTFGPGKPTRDFALVGLTATGAPDSQFGGNTSPAATSDFGDTYDSIDSIALLPDGRIAAAGSQTPSEQSASASSIALALYNSDGSPDTGFSGDGLLMPANLSLSASSKLVISGGDKLTLLDTAFGPNNDQVAVVRFTSQGALDTTFSGDGVAAPLNTVTVGSAFDGVIAVDAIGQIVIGYDQKVETGNFARLVRLNSDGTVDGSFNDPGALGSKGFTGTSNRLLVGSNNRLIVATAITSNDLVLMQFQGTHPPKPILQSLTGATGANTVSVKIQYQGESPIDASTVTLNNVRLVGAGEYDQPAVSIGTPVVDKNNLTVTYQFTPPGGTADATDSGNYQVVFQAAGAVDTNGNTVQPAAIPAKLDIGVGAVLPDFAFSNTTFNPGDYFVGDSIAAALTATATGSTVKPFNLRVVLSADNINGNADDIELLRQTVTTASTTITSLGPIPQGVAPGNYFLIASLDPDGTVAEVDETNNVLMSNEPTITIIPPKSDPPPQIIGGLDLSYGTGGMIRPKLGFASTGGVVEQPGGSILIVGSFVGSGNTDVGIARRTSDGNSDPTFGNGTGQIAVDMRGTDDRVVDLALLPDGSILVAGTSEDPGGGGGSDFFVTRRNSDGSNAAGFGTDGRTFINFGLNGIPSRDDARDLLIDSEGRILVIGRTDAGSGGVNFAIARLTAGGVLDTTFGVGGRQITDFGGGDDIAEAAALTSNNSIVMTGSATVGSARVVSVARYTADGILDSKFGTNGLATATAGNPDERASAISVSPSGQIVVAGFTSGGTIGTSSFFSRFLVASFTSKGQLDKKFGNQGVATIDPGAPARATYVEILADGGVIVSGISSSTIAQGVASAFDFAILRLTKTGDADASFGGDGSIIIETDRTTSGIQSNANSLLAVGESFSPLATVDELLADFQASSEGKLTVRTTGDIDSVYIAGTNGSETIVVVIVTSGVELSGEVLSSVPSDIIGGSKGSISVSVSNLGDLIAQGAIDVTFYASTDQKLGSGDLEFHGITGKTVKLKPLGSNGGKAKKLTTKFIYPSNLPNGAYYLLAEIQPGTIVDLSTNNNTAFTSTKVEIAAPVIDLTGPDFAGGVTFVTGRPTSVPITLRNDGNIPTSKTASLVFVFSADETLDADDTTLSGVLFKLSLKGNTTKQFKVKLTPPTLTAGSYFLYVIVDSLNDNSEVNESNNLLKSTLASTLQ